MKLLKYFPVIFLGLLACEPPRDLTYTGPTTVEFKNDRVNAAAATFLANNTFNSRTIRQIITQDSVLVQLVGVQRDQPTEVSYEVATGNTAIEGTHYNFLSTKGKVTIPAKKSAAYIRLAILQGIPTTVPATQDFKLVLNLTGNADTKPSENYKSFTFNIRR